MSFQWIHFYFWISLITVLWPRIIYQVSYFTTDTIAASASKPDNTTPPNFQLSPSSIAVRMDNVSKYSVGSPPTRNNGGVVLSVPRFAMQYQLHGATWTNFKIQISMLPRTVVISVWCIEYNRFAWSVDICCLCNHTITCHPTIWTWKTFFNFNYAQNKVTLRCKII